MEEIFSYPLTGHQTGSMGYGEKFIIGQLISLISPELVIETGTFKGQTTQFVSEYLIQNGFLHSKIATFDLPETFAEAKRNNAYLKDAHNIELIAGWLPWTLKSYLENQNKRVDLAIIDADHTYNSVYYELKLIDKYISDRGYILCHDYVTEYNETIYAIESFARANNYYLLPLLPTEDIKGDNFWGSALLRKKNINIKLFSSLKYRVKYKINRINLLFYSILNRIRKRSK